MPIKGMAKVKKAISKDGDIYTNANDSIRAVYLGGLFNIIIETPADTGRARNNWFLSADSPSSKSTKGKSGGLSLVSKLQSMPKRVLNRKVFMTNNLPYIGTLEYGGYPNPVENGSWIKGKYQKLSQGGFSKQAPGGWVRVILIKMQNKIRGL